MPPNDRAKHAHHDEHHHDKKRPGKGPKEKEIAATLTAATVALAGSSTTFSSLEAASDAVAGVYARMFELVAAEPPPKS